jgi:hypothetical protein
LSLVGQLTFQIVLITNGIYDNPDKLNCSFRQQVLEEIGYSRFDQAYWYDIVRIVVPDAWMLLVSIATLLVCQYLAHYNRAIKRLADTQRALNTTAFTDNFCPLANVNKEPGTGILTAQISHINIEGFETTEGSSSTNENPPQPGSPVAKPKQKKLNRQKSILTKGVSPIMKFCKALLPSLLHLIFLGLLFLCGSVWPSLLTIPYFVFYIFFMAKWSLAKQHHNYHNSKVCDNS